MHMVLDAMDATMALSRAVACTGALGGRLDHTLGNLNALYMHSEMPFALLGEGNCVRLLHSGHNRIHVTESEEKHCGVIPLGGPAVVSSKGLAWDMGAPQATTSLVCTGRFLWHASVAQYAAVRCTCALCSTALVYACADAAQTAVN
jgi:thiamine pyrophosphokinase